MTKTSNSKHNQTSKAASSTIQPVPTTASVSHASTAVTSKANLNNSTHSLQNNSIPASNPIHFPPTQPPNIHNSAALAGQHSNRQMIPNHPAVSFPNLQVPQHPPIHSQSQIPPNYGLHGQNLHNLHNLHNPYAYQQPPSHPSAHHQLPPHLQGHLPPSPSHPYPPNLHPQLASQLAATGFGYPPSSFYDPSFAYFGHPNQYHPYYNSHHPQHPQAAPTALHPHLQAPSHHLQATTTAATTAAAKSISITQPNTTQSNTTTNTKSNNSTPATSQ